MLLREGFEINHKRTYRLYKTAGLALKKRNKKKYEKRGMPERAITEANMRWSMDFVSDKTRCGSNIRVLAVIDEVTRECLALEVDSSITGRKVAAVLNRIAIFRGMPQEILTDNGSEFTSNVMIKGRKFMSELVAPPKISLWPEDIMDVLIASFANTTLEGEGNPLGKIIIALDNPGRREDKEGIPSACGELKLEVLALLYNGINKCPCKKKECSRFSKCEECIAFHNANKKYAQYCLRTKKPNTNKSDKKPEDK